MTDHNKVRDEVCDNPEYNIGDTKMDALLLHNRKFGWNECVKHLSKQSVAFDPSNSWPVLMKVCKSLGINPASKTYNDLSALLERQHQQTAAIYEAKLAIANNLIRACAGFVYNHDNVGITKADVKEYINALDKESK